MKTRALALLLILLIGTVAAQSGVTVKSGLVKAASPIYGLDRAVDELQVLSGIKTQGDVAYERASEMKVAQERNHTMAYQRAQTQLWKTANRSTNESRAGLQNAEAVLLAIQANATENATRGLETALDSLRRAQERGPQKETGLFGNYGRDERSGVIQDLDERTGREDLPPRGRR